MRKKIKTCILHIGTCKTGTSYIQSNLYNNHNYLLTRKIYYPKIVSIGHFLSFTPIFVDKPRNYYAFIDGGIVDDELIASEINKLKDIWINEFKACSERECDTFIVSAENLAELNENEINNIRMFLKPYFEEIKIIIYVRPYKKFIQSFYQQIIKSCVGSLDITARKCSNPNIIETFMQTNDLYYSNNIKHWIKKFDIENVTIKPFDKNNFLNNNLLDDFLSILNMDSSEFEITKDDENASLNNMSVCFLLNYNKYYPRYHDNNKNTDRFFFDLPLDIFNTTLVDDFSIKLHFTKEQADILNNEIEFINQYFKDGYKFEYITPSDESSVYPKSEKIPSEFYVELFNNFCKHYAKNSSVLYKEIDRINTEWGKQRDYIIEQQKEIDRVNMEWGKQRDYIEQLKKELNDKDIKVKNYETNVSNLNTIINQNKEEIVKQHNYIKLIHNKFIFKMYFKLKRLLKKIIRSLN
ncbi:hypothetical protein [Clostridium sp. OS1-26]|uniref:hypothetical protein n=1 Tax=Clostridium sp. OS1-26 TaxID=3070681 RepID=UPI0027E0F2A2|nr:hypothetical protein [Clostridium sp. OS1-26]WML36757.1 hypothetical protein RCG18_09080 [Clostridium sp. OS1-26]